MISNIAETITLHNGVQMPQLGFGVFKVKMAKKRLNPLRKQSK